MNPNENQFHLHILGVKSSNLPPNSKRGLTLINLPLVHHCNVTEQEEGEFLGQLPTTKLPNSKTLMVVLQFSPYRFYFKRCSPTLTQTTISHPDPQGSCFPVHTKFGQQGGRACLSTLKYFHNFCWEIQPFYQQAFLTPKESRESLSLNS